MFLEAFFFIAVVAALLLLVFVFVRGMGRGHRFRSFTSKRGGEFSTQNTHGLDVRVRSLLDDEVWVGYSARLEDHGVARYVFDVHEQVDGSPRKTAAITESPEPFGSQQIVVREAIPDSSRSKKNELRDRYEIVGAAWEELPEPVRSTLRERPSPLSHPNHDWLLEIRVEGTELFVAARDRPLSSSDEWSALLEMLDRLRERC